MDEEQTASTPWCNAKTVGPPLIRYLMERRTAGEDFNEWISTLRALNRSWCQEMTCHIKRVTSSGYSVEQLPKSLLGSLSHVKDLVVQDIGMTSLEFDEEAGSVRMDVDQQAQDILNSAANIQTLSLSYAAESVTEMGVLIPMTSLRSLSIRGVQSLNVVEKCPNLENLVLEDCRFERIKCNPGLRSLSLLTQGMQELRIDKTPIASYRAILPRSYEPPLLNDLAKLTQLTELKFACGITNASEHFQSWCETLRGLRSLQVLRLVVTDGRLFGGGRDEFKHILNALPSSLRELEVWGLLGPDDNRILLETTSLQKLEKLTMFSLGGHTSTVGYPDLKWVIKLPNLVELSLLWGNVRGKAFAWLRNLSKLRRLALNLESISSEAFKQLCWVGDNLKQIEVWYPGDAFESDPEVVEAKRVLEDRGVQVTVVAERDSTIDSRRIFP